jgi:hypothetical protein
MGLKKEKYLYIERKDGWYVKVRALNIRLKKKGKEKVSYDITDPTRYVLTGIKTRRLPFKAQILKEDDVPPDVRKLLYYI